MLPGSGTERVLVQEIRAARYLISIYRDYEVEVHQRSRLFAAYP
jgi:hypothetical protein